MPAPRELPALSVHAEVADDDPRTLEVVVGGHIDPADVPRLCDAVCSALSSHDVDRVVCDVSAVDAPDAVWVEALARLQLATRRLDRKVSLRHATAPLRDLLAFTGLAEILPQTPT